MISDHKVDHSDMLLQRWSVLLTQKSCSFRCDIQIYSNFMCTVLSASRMQFGTMRKFIFEEFFDVTDDEFKMCGSDVLMHFLKTRYRYPPSMIPNHKLDYLRCGITKIIFILTRLSWPKFTHSSMRGCILYCANIFAVLYQYRAFRDNRFGFMFEEIFWHRQWWLTMCGLHVLVWILKTIHHHQ